MRNKNKIVGFVVAALLVSFFAVVTSAQSRRYHGMKQFYRYTRNLPAIDKIELVRLRDTGQNSPREISGRRFLTGKAVQRIASLWRRQEYNDHLAACHEPGYAVKFYSGRRVIVEATVCWSCNSILFSVPKADRTQSFEGYNKEGEALSELFRRYLP